MKQIEFSKHALIQMKERGVTHNEVIDAIRNGEPAPAFYERKAFRKNFVFQNNWGGNFHNTKQVMPVVVEEHNKIVVVTVYSFYF